MKKILFLSLLSLFSTALFANNTPIIFVHGMLAAGDTWENPIHHFRANGYSENELNVLDWNTLDFNRENGLAVLEQLVQKVLKTTGAKKVNLIGHSAGGGLCISYLKNKKNRKKVAHYIHVGSTKLTEDPLVPTLNVYSPDDKITGGEDNPNTENKSIPGLDHYEIATSDASFQAYFEFITKKQPLLEYKNGHNLPLTLAGKACTLGENQPEVNATIQIFALDTETGNRINDEAVFETKTDENGLWSGFEAKAETTYEFVIKSADEKKRTIHYYHLPFTHANHHIYLRTMPTGGFAGILLGNLPQNDEEACLAIFSAQKAVIHKRDQLLLNSFELANEELAPAQKTPIAFFVYSSIDSEGISHASFKSLPFMAGVNKKLEIDNGMITVQLNEQLINLQPIKSSEGIMVIVFRH